MNVTRTVSRGAAGRTDPLVPVFEFLREEVHRAIFQAWSHEALAFEVGAILQGAKIPDATSNRVVLHLAWVAAVHAPGYDPVLVATLPFCLESIAEGYGTMEDFFVHIETAGPVPGAPRLPDDLPSRTSERLAREIRDAVSELHHDPRVFERIIDRIAWDDAEGAEGVDDPLERPSGLTATPCGFGSVVQRLPAAVREAVVSVLQVEPAPGAVPLMQQIAGRLDGRSVRRLAAELVHVSGDEASLRVRVRAAASLFAMHRDGCLDASRPT